MIILIHSSKTMRHMQISGKKLRRPQHLSEAEELAQYIKTLSKDQLEEIMHLSPALAAKTAEVAAEWTSSSDQQSPAIDSFSGDIYSGLRPHEMSPNDRDYADEVLRILSGLYGILRPLDGISPYRLEMGYSLPSPAYSNLYNFWGEKIAGSLPSSGIIINTSAVEYTKSVLPYIDPSRVITPKFLTIDKKKNKPHFVAVHAKIARGAFARWLILNRICEPEDFKRFDDLGYAYYDDLSKVNSPVYICQKFTGLGLSVR